MTRKKSARGKPGPKPGFMPAVNQRRVAARAARVGLLAALGLTKPTSDDEAYIAAVRKDPLKHSRQVRTMPYSELKLYAKGLHVPQHNIDGLTHDKLIQNCLLQVASVIEALTGD